ncbi:hypothetical protein H5410_015414 [Solanum commersonii]|uniref:Ubiquitin-like protease family profile domain-containing protein n=1 Tax=Solanum commersonii TaxID=4109 RepID=A0A9J5ZTL3_SOLCO|nr:hypothetical protein H5410_015414 [Solanum commersonii]
MGEFIEGIEAFNNYPWGHDNFELTVKYLLKPLSPKTNNLFGFPWAFMAWAFEAISHLTHQGWLKPYVILLWIELKWNWLEQEPSKETELNELVVFYGVDVGGGIDVGGDIGAGAGQDQGATSCRRCSGFLYENCKKQDEDFIVNLQTLSQAVNEFKNKRGIKYIDEILSLIWERHVRYPEYYDSTNRILDLNFCSNFKQRYDKMSEEATTVGGKALHSMEHAKFLTFLQPVFELLPKLLKQSEIMKHLPDKFLNEPWEFEGRLEPMVTNDTKTTCGSYSLAFIKHLITRTTIQPPQTLLCDNIVGRMQWVWAGGIVYRSLEP